MTVPATPIAASTGHVGQELRDEGAGCVGVLAEALGQPHAADVEARVLLRAGQLGRAAADVDDHRPRVERPSGGDSAVGQRGLLVAGEEPVEKP